MRNFMLIALLGCALLVLPAAALGQEIPATEGDIIEAETGGQSDEVRVKISPKVTITFLVQDVAGWRPVGPQGLRYGETFKVAVEFSQAPEETPVKVDLELEGTPEPRSIELQRQEISDNLYHSPELLMEYDQQPRLKFKIAL